LHCRPAHREFPHRQDEFGYGASSTTAARYLLQNVDAPALILERSLDGFDLSLDAPDAVATLGES
jgi:hypothetical protein